MCREKTCCFTGHRELGYDFDVSALRSAIADLIERGVTTFITGGALGFDTVAASEVIAFKKKGCQIQLHIYAPCNNQSERWSFKDKQTYKVILKDVDFVSVPNTPYYDGCMRARNYKMVDASAYCIAYYNRARTGTGQTVRYAESKGLEVINISNG